MRRASRLLAAILVVWGAKESANAFATEASPERLSHLVEQLGSARFADREAATRALDALGEAALDALRSAAKSPDAETRRRANELVDRISQRVAVTRLLQPNTVTLDFHDAPLAEAVKTLAKATRLPIELPPNAHKTDRKVTVTSQPLPIWEALELFCQKAGLHEWDGFSGVPGLSMAASQQRAMANGVIAGPQGQIFFSNGPNRSHPYSGKVVLIDGPEPALAVHHAGAVRLRLLPSGTPFPHRTAADQILLPLQASAESRLHWSGAISVRVDKAVDDLGRAHDATGIVSRGGANDDMPWMVGANSIVPRLGPAALQIQRKIPSAKKLTEISGEMTAQVRVTEPLARVDGPLKAGMTAQGVDGVNFKITNLTTLAPGDVKISIDLDLPPDVQPIGPMSAFTNGRVAFQGGIVLQQQQLMIGGNRPAPALPAGTTEYFGLALEDGQSRRWTAAAAYQESMRLGPQGISTQLVIVYKSPAADSAASRLVFHGSRPAIISIPFTFRDVPLP